jgi:hypothetical protein
MLPLILVAVGAYLIGDSVLGDKKSYADGGMMAKGGEIKYVSYTGTLFNPKEVKMHKTKEEAEERLESLKGESGLIPYKNWLNQEKYADGGNYEPINFSTSNQTEESAKKWLNELIKERGRNEAAKIVRYNLTGKNPYYRYNNIYDQWLSSATLNEKYANGGMMAKGGNIYRRQSIKSFYVDTYPTDNLGQEINGEASFEGLNKVLDCNIDVYEYLGVGDSLVRERVFSKLAELMGVSYDVIYDKWLKSDYAKGGKLVGKQKNLDVNKNGKLDAEDFKILRGEKMAKGGKIRSQKEFNELVAEKEKIVKNLSSKEISEMWNKNSNSPSKMTEDEAKTSTSKMYLRDLLVEKELTKAEYNKYFAKGGKLVGKQKNLDVNKNGKLDAEDFKMLRKGKKMAKGGEIYSGKDIKITIPKMGKFDEQKVVAVYDKDNFIFKIYDKDKKRVLTKMGSANFESNLMNGSYKMD